MQMAVEANARAKSADIASRPRFAGESTTINFEGSRESFRATNNWAG